jgi:hypothetical protein
LSNRDLEEYRNLRATIKDRGTARVWIFVVGLSAWGALAAAASGQGRPAWELLVPLVVIAGVFEAVFALHTGAERVGRYLQVFHEGAADQGWEHRVMAIGRAGAMTFGGDALFSPIVIAAIVVNFAAGAAASPAPAELVVLGGAHLAAFGRVLDARRRAKGQREADLAAFTKSRELGVRSSEL